MFQPLLNDVLKKVAPWHQYIGGPGFPAKYLFNKNSGFGNPKKLNLEYHDDGWIRSIEGENDAEDTAKFILSWDDTNKVSTAVLSLNDTSELTIQEKFVTSTKIRLDTTYHADSDYNTRIEMTKPATFNDPVALSIEINSTTLTGSMTVGDPSVPQIMLDLVDELDTMSSTETVAAFADNIINAICVEAWRQGSYTIDEWQWILNCCGTIMSDTFGPGVSCIYAVVCGLLSEKSVAS